MKNKTLRVRCYPSRLADDDLDTLQDFAFRGWQQAPEFCSWFVDVMQSEQIRRLKGEAVERFALPEKCSNQFIAQGLIVTMAMDMGAMTATSQRFLDSLRMAVVCFASCKLERLG
jgi:hypothetical protein